MRMNDWKETFVELVLPLARAHQVVLDVRPFGHTVLRPPQPVIEPVQVQPVVRLRGVPHVPLTDDTKGLFSEKHFATVKPGAVIINTSRGAVIDEKALLTALESKRVKAAGLDVLTDEPDIERSALLHYAKTHDNLILTPHCGGFSHDAVKIVCRRAAEKIVEHLNL